MVASALDTPVPAVVSVDGTKVWAGQAGRPAAEAPVIVFIPGFASSAIVFDKQFQDESLLSKFCLIAYEPRGQGRSRLLADAEASSFSSEKHAQDFEAVILFYGAKRVFIAGWSAGGVIPADVFAHSSPDYVAGVILLAATPYRAVFPAVAWPSGATIFGPLTQPADGNELATAITRFVDICIYEPNRAGMSFAFRSALAGAVAEQLPRTRAMVGAGGQTQDPAKLLAAAPSLAVLFIMGEQDAVSQPDKLEARVRHDFPLTQVLLLKDCGHSPFWEKPAEVNAAMAAFVDSVLKGSG